MRLSMAVETEISVAAIENLKVAKCKQPLHQEGIIRCMATFHHAWPCKDWGNAICSFWAINKGSRWGWHRRVHKIVRSSSAAHISNQIRPLDNAADQCLSCAVPRWLRKLHFLILTQSRLCAKSASSSLLACNVAVWMTCTVCLNR